MKCLVTCLLMAAVLLHLVTEGGCVCCHFGFCQDCSFGDPYCGSLAGGGCNAMGCNCDGGCRTGSCGGRGKRTVSDVISAADVDGDHWLSLGEAELHLARVGFPLNEWKRALNKMDLDQNGRLTLEEIEPN